jgi:hypothetical protein
VNWRAFLKALAENGVVLTACDASGVSRCRAYQKRREDPKFAAAWEQAIEDAADRLEAEAVKRARKRSDRLLEFLLKARRPEVFGDHLTIRVIEEAKRRAYALPQEKLLEGVSDDELAKMGYERTTD